MNINNKKDSAHLFVEEMHKMGIAMDAFVKLINKWNDLTTTQRQEAFDICRKEHPRMYRGVFPGEK